MKILLILLSLLPHRYATVTSKVYEGGNEDDRYILHLDKGGFLSTLSDDLEVDDRVTVYYWCDDPIYVLYGER